MSLVLKSFYNKFNLFVIILILYINWHFVLKLFWVDSDWDDPFWN